MNRRGMTLVELLVVLVILAIMTTIAVTMTSQFSDQARYNATQQTLQNIQAAIVGPSNQRGADGSLLVTGFVADMGDLPAALTASDPLRELWDTTVFSGAANAYSLQTFPRTGTTNALNGAGGNTGSYGLGFSPSSPCVTLPCGWHGPYLQVPGVPQVAPAGTPAATLPAGTVWLADGWGRPFDAMSQSTSGTYSLTSWYGLSPASGTLAAGASISLVRSLGADGQVNAGLPANPYDLNLYAPTQSASVPTTPLTSFASAVNVTVSVTVQAVNNTVTPVSITNPYSLSGTTGNSVRVTLFTPGRGTLAGTLQAYNLDSVSGSTDLTSPGTATDFTVAGTPTGTTPPTTAAVSGTFTNVAIGPRWIQAFQYDSTSTINRRSPLTPLVVTPSGTLSITLILQ